MSVVQETNAPILVLMTKATCRFKPKNGAFSVFKTYLACNCL